MQACRRRVRPSWGVPVPPVMLADDTVPHPNPTVISFFGDGPKQLHIDADTAMQPIDHVNFTFRGSTDQLVAAGSCRFSNPYKGKPARVSCTADTNQGKFAGEFISNGVAPNMSQSR